MGDWLECRKFAKMNLMSEWSVGFYYDLCVEPAINICDALYGIEHSALVV